MGSIPTPGTFIMNNQPIGILDSGVGGLSIWREIVKQLPHESTIYIADSKNCPYGTRAATEIYPLARRLTKFLVDKKVKLIVVACNTVAVCALKELRSNFKNVPIIGIVPVIKTAAEQTKNKRIGIIATKTTAASGYEKELIKAFASDCNIINIGTEKLVPFVERGDTKSAAVKKAIKEVVDPFIKNNIDVLVLGCSHFSFLRKSAQQILGKDVLILDSASAVARHVGRVLTQNKALSLHKKPSYRFYTTGEASSFRKVAVKLIGKQLVKKVSHAKL